MLIDGDPDIHLTVDLSDRAGVKHLTLAGDLDLGGAEVLDAALAEVNATEPVELDLSGIEFVDSSGIRSLIVARSTRPVLLVAPSRAVLHTFEIANVLHLLEPA